MKKRIVLSIVLALVMMMSILPMSAFAAEEIPSFVDLETKTITIANPTDMRWLSTYDGSISGLDATFVNWTINIVADIDLENVLWTPIANFRGKMIGVTDVENGVVTISNLKVNVTDANAEGAGLCAKSGGGARFENLKISSSEITSSAAYAGAFIGNGFTSTFVNCHTFNTSVTGYRFVGGISGFNYGSMTKCSVKADDGKTMIYANGSTNVTANGGDNAGGLVGQIGEGSFEYKDCEVSGITVKAARQSGGIAGMAMYGNVLDHCTVSETTVQATARSTVFGAALKRYPAAGGLVGQLQPSDGQEITFKNNVVESSVSIYGRTTSTTEYCGWLIGNTRGAIPSETSGATQLVIENNNTYPLTGLNPVGSTAG